MNKLNLKVTANRIEVVKDSYSTQGCVNYDSCSFSFDSEWDSFDKTAVFGFGNDDYIRVRLEADTCKIPAVCMAREGYIRIGVYGINDENTVIATNCIAHRVDEGVGNVEDWLEEDASIVFNALAELEDSLEEYKKSLDTRFDKLADTLGEGADSSCEPSDWYIPAPFKDADNLPSYSKNSSYNEYLDYILNRLVEDYPDYASRIRIGTDESGLYPIYAYSFEPANYEKTVFVSACLDGTESSPMIALSWFLADLCSRKHENRTLGYLRSRVKLVVVPVGNPFGLLVAGPHNRNGVRIDRNFDFRWSDCTERYKGDSAADQKETQAIQNFLQSISTDRLCAAVHFNDRSNLFSGKMLFYPRFRNNCLDALTNALYRYNYEERNENDLLSASIIAPTLNPTLINYAAEQFGINACTVNWPSLSYGGSQNNEGVTKFTELIGNMIYTIAKNSTFTLRGARVPFTKYFSWRSTGDTDTFAIPQSQSFKKAPITSCQLVMRSPCNVTVNGYAIIRAVNPCTVRINPLLWQDYSPEQTYSERADMTDFVIEIPLSAGTHVIPFDSVLQAYYSDNNGLITSGYPEKLNFSIGVCADTASAAKLTGFSATLNAFPCNIGRSVEISRPMGTAEDYTSQNDVPTQELIFPKETLISGENGFYD